MYIIGAKRITAIIDSWAHMQMHLAFNYMHRHTHILETLSVRMPENGNDTTVVIKMVPHSKWSSRQQIVEMY